MSLVEFDELNKNDLGYNGVPTYEKGFEAGQQSQQGEVDKLQTKIDELNERHSEEKRILHNVIEMNQAKIDELQARVDKALYHLDFNHDNDKDIAINILKGNEDEN